MLSLRIGNKLQQVSSDAEAIELMNDSEYGLTASIWTKSLDDFSTLADQVQAGTIFLNRYEFFIQITGTPH